MNLSTQVKLIAMFSMIFTAQNCLEFISTIILLFMKAGHATLALGIQILIYVIWIVSENLCLLGAIKNNQRLLIPFLFCQFLTILLCFGYGILSTYVGYGSVNPLFGYINRYGHNGSEYAGIGVVAFFRMHIPLLIVLGFAIYFFYVVVKFYNEILQGARSRQLEVKSSSPYTSSLEDLPGGSFSNVHDHVATQNLTYTYQQQATNETYRNQGKLVRQAKILELQVI